MILHSQADTRPLPPEMTPKDKEDASKQADMVLWLLLNGGMQDVAAQVVYGGSSMDFI